MKTMFKKHLIAIILQKETVIALIVNWGSGRSIINCIKNVLAVLTQLILIIDLFVHSLKFLKSFWRDLVKIFLLITKKKNWTLENNFSILSVCFLFNFHWGLLRRRKIAHLKCDTFDFEFVKFWKCKSNHTKYPPFKLTCMDNAEM